MSEESLHHLAGRLLEEVGHALQMVLEVVLGAAFSCTPLKCLAGVVGECVKEDVDLRLPPAVDRLLGHARALGDALDGQGGEPPLDQEVVRGMEYCDPDALAASRTGSADDGVLVAGRLWLPRSADGSFSLSSSTFPRFWHSLFTGMWCADR